MIKIIKNGVINNNEVNNVKSPIFNYDKIEITILIFS